MYRPDRTERAFRVEQLEDRIVLSTMMSAEDLSAVVSAAHGDLSKLDSTLITIHQQHTQASAQADGLGSLPEALIESLYMADGGVGVQIASMGNVESLLAELGALEFQETDRVNISVAGWLPIDQLDELAALDRVRFASAVLRPITHENAGQATFVANSTGDTALSSDQARETFGVDGSGVLVGVISDSYNADGGASGDIAAGELPGAGNPNGFTTPVQVLNDDPTGTDEGRAMAQIVHDVAPGAALAFHSSFNNPGVLDNTIAVAIDALRGAGADVIVDDVAILTTPFFQDSFAARAVDRAFADGAAYFSSAGNSDRQSYESAYTDSGMDLMIAAMNQGRLHDFDPGAGVDTFQAITIPVGASLRISFQWDQPYATLAGAGSASDYNIFVLDSTGTTILGQSVTNNIGGDPFEFLVFTNASAETNLNIAITRVGGPNAGLIKYIDFNGAMTIVDFDTASSTVFGHANAAGAMAVGAAAATMTPRFGVNPPVLEPFSSAGNTPILFDAAGNRLAAPEIRNKPDIVAPDGVETSVPGFNPFFGTSAAAPHAAGVAALMIDRAGDLPPQSLYNVLETTAIDMNTPGFDTDSGFGLIDSLAAVGAVPGVADGTLALSFTTLDDLGIFDLRSDGSIIVTLNGMLLGPFADVESVSVDALAGDDVIRLLDAFQIPFMIDGGPGTDTLDLSFVNENTEIVLGPDAQGTSTFDNIEIVTTGAGDDTFVFNSFVDGMLDGGNGTDTFDFSPMTTAVQIDLATGALNGLTFNSIERALGPLFQSNLIEPSAAAVNSENTLVTFGDDLSGLGSATQAGAGAALVASTYGGSDDRHRLSSSHSSAGAAADSSDGDGQDQQNNSENAQSSESIDADAVETVMAEIGEEQIAS